MSLEGLSLVESTTLRTILGTVFTLGAALGAGALVTPAIAQRVLPKPKETHLADFLPFDRLAEDGRTVVCRDGRLTRFFAVSGTDQSFLQQNESYALFRERKEMIDALAEISPGVFLRVYTIRERIPTPQETGHPSGSAQRIARLWNEQFANAFTTRSIMAVTTSGSGSKDSQALDDAEQVILDGLQNYNPVPLTQNPLDSPSSDYTVGTLLGALASPITRPRPKAFGEYLSDAIAADEVEFFPNGRIKFSSGKQDLHAAAIGVRRLADYTSVQLSNQLSALNHASVILQTLEPIPKTRALIKLGHDKLHMAQTSLSPEVEKQFTAAQQMLEGLDEHKCSILNFSEVVFLFADSEAELDDAVRDTRQIMTNNSVTPVVERSAAQPSWFMQFPTYDTRPRTYRLMSPNVSQLAAFDRPPSGLPHSDWGKGPIARFMTGASSVYNHQFHATTEEAAVGHGLVIAPTGSGKTVLMEFLSAMASRHRDLRHFFFDRYRGTYVYTTAMGGQYLSLNAERLPLSTIGGMNPFQCDPTADNRDFLKVWLSGLAGQSQDPDSHALDQISNAIDIAFTSLDRNERSLAAIYEGAFEPASPTAKALHKWVDAGQYGEMFNAASDAIDLDDNWLTTFDMTNLLNDPILAGPSVEYIMHRIRQTMQNAGAPGFIFIDETKPLLENPHFRHVFLVLLQEFRKLRGVIISVFQSPAALRATGIGEVVRQQSAAWYLFPNTGASEADYEEFELSSREMDFVLGRSGAGRRLRRPLLIKKPAIRESVIIDIDLSPLQENLKLLSSTSTDVRRAAALQEADPLEWIEKYLRVEAP